MKPLTLTVICVVLVSFCVAGCSSKGNPIAETTEQQADRSVDLFLPADVVTVFPTPVAPNDVYHDVDSAVLTSNDTPCEIDGRYWTAFVSLKRDDPVNNPQRFRPYLRLVPDGPPTDGGFAMEDEIPVPTQFDLNCRAVKCAAYVGTYVNIVIVYEINNPVGDNGWDVGVTRLFWQPADFPDAGLMSVETHLLASPSDERWPDIAIDQLNGMGFIVFSDYLTVTIVRLGYRRCESIDTASTSWSAYYPIQDNFGQYNWHLPRIDVGLLENVFGPDPVNCVGVAYTAQYCDLLTPDVPHNGYHVHFLGWRPDVVEKNVVRPHAGVILICLRCPLGFDAVTGTPGNGTYQTPGNTYFLDAGMQYIDIAPSGNDGHYGVVAFAQVVGNDNYGPITQIWSADAMSLWFASLTDAQPGWADGMYPSIAWHYGQDMASLTYFRQVPFTDQYHPWIARVVFQAPPEGPAIWGGTSNPIGNPTDYITTGILNRTQVEFLNPGPAGAIQVLALGNPYWAAWCNRLQMEPAPTTVMAAWGNTMP